MESFAALFEESLARQDMRSGEVISAEVVRLDHNFVIVNAGLKSEAFIPIEEFKNDQGELEVKVGDFVSVAIESLENGFGDTILSRDKAKRLASWLALEKAMESGEIVTGTVNGKVKGGLTVLTNGIRAFLPGSLVDTRPVKDTTPFEGKTLEFKVIKLDRKRNNVVLSRRAVIEASMGEERAKLMETLKEGTVVTGVVKNITDYGAFIDLGGIDGLLHITDMSWGRVGHPSELFKVNDEVVWGGGGQKIEKGQTIRLGKTTMLQFIHTPGHTYDHICILVDNSKILTGDTMLIGDVGRIDLGGDPRDKSDKLYDSLHGKLLKLADAIEVYPTHVGTAHHLATTSTSSTIAKETENNGALKLKTKDEFFKYMTEDWPPKPPDYQNIIRLNRGEVTISQLG